MKIASTKHTTIKNVNWLLLEIITTYQTSQLLYPVKQQGSRTTLWESHTPLLQACCCINFTHNTDHLQYKHCYNQQFTTRQLSAYSVEVIRWNFTVSFINTRVRPIPCRRPIPNTISRSYTDTDTGLYNSFVLKMWYCAGYRCVQVIYVCGVYARKYGIGLKL